MSSEPTTVEKLRALPWSIASSASLTVFVQLTYFGSVFVLFLDELGLSKGQVGFVLSLLPFTALIAIPIAPAVARYGYKRTYVQAFGIRTFVTVGLLLTPWVTFNLGPQAALLFVSGIVTVFALLRAVGVTASFPWTQEYVPNAVRGKYSARTNFFSTITGFLAISLASFVLARTAGLSGYMFLIATGIIFGFVSAWLATHIPGGAPVQPSKAQEARHRDLGMAVRDPDFMRYLVGVGLFTVATVPLASFLPLFMQEEVGLSSAQAVRLQNGVLVGSLLSSYIWGWFADRYGSKPVMLWGVLLRVLVVVGWLIMPRFTPLSLYAALAIAFMQGVADVGWGVGSARLLYVSVVPPARKADYMALYWAWTGLVGGLSQLGGGRIVELSQGIDGQLGFLKLDPYLPLFLLGLLLPIVAIVLFQRINDDSTMGMGRFAGIFLRGNPLLAVEAVLRYSRARDEHAAVRVTERLGQAKSPLTVEELLEALEDPRFNVRFEALVSIARTKPEPRLTEALIRVLQGSDPALSVVAAWALGRTGDERAVKPLRHALDSRYRSVQAHSSRALAVLGDLGSMTLLAERLSQETDQGLQVAYASALGQMRVKSVTPQVLDLLHASQDDASRREVALALARIVGDEHHFVQLHREVHRQPATASAQAALALKKRVEGRVPALAEALDATATQLAREEMEAGLVALAGALRLATAQPLPTHQRQILDDCADHLASAGPSRLEYAVLALHTVHVAW